ncbi:hypothetical protein NDU88_000706 [Pleurodeles waltl]|uniref:Uncharacterized protein n=1 Tax=Pleurodeles waltl TaxID=8319 RepID=A0AAV7SXE1_PLEWA|nr:hypothetical protein NDU88_000706 [Pleurodeles waltl]
MKASCGAQELKRSLWSHAKAFPRWSPVGSVVRRITKKPWQMQIWAEEDLQRRRGLGRSRRLYCWRVVRADPQQLGETAEAVITPTGNPLAEGTVSCSKAQSAHLERSPMLLELQRRDCPCKDEVLEAGATWNLKIPPSRNLQALVAARVTVHRESLLQPGARAHCLPSWTEGKEDQEGHSEPPPVPVDPRSSCGEQIPAARRLCLRCLRMQGNDSFTPKEIPSCFFGAAEVLLTPENAQPWKC